MNEARHHYTASATEVVPHRSPLAPTLQRGRPQLDRYLVAALSLSVIGATRIGPVTLSALGTVVLSSIFMLAALRPGTAIPPSVAMCAAPLAAVLLVMTASTIGGRIELGGLQQAAVWAGAAAAIIYGHQVAHADRFGRLPNRITRAAERSTIVIVTLTAVDSFLVSIPGASPRIAALGTLIPLCWFVSRWDGPRTRQAAFAYAICIFNVLTLSRTAAAVAVLILVLGRPTRRSFRSVRLATRLGVFVVVGLVLVTYWQPLRQRFFTGDVSLALNGLSINGSGRSTVWSGLWAGVWERPLAGHGLGTVRERTQAIAPGITHPHQEYLRLLYEGGFLCLAIFLVGIAMSWSAASRIARSTSGVPNQAAVAARLAIAVVLLTSLTDNSLVYPFIMLPYGLVLGVGLGIRGTGQSE